MNRKSVLLVFIAFITLHFQAGAQLKWANQDSLFGPLPSSIHVQSFSGLFDGHTIKAWYVSVRIDDRKIQLNAKTTLRTPSDHSVNNPNAFLIVNGGLFDSADFRLLSTVISNAKVMAYNITSLRSNQSGFYYYPTRSAFGISRKRGPDIAWLFTDSLRRWPYAFQSEPILARGKQQAPILPDLNTMVEWREWKMRTAIGGGPVLVHDSKIRVTNQEEQLYPMGMDDPDARTVIGYTSDRRLIVVAVEGRSLQQSDGISLKQAAAIMQSLGCVEAMNLNVGNNAFMLVNGKETIRRSVQNQLIPVIFVAEPAGKDRKKSRFRLK